MIPLSVFVVHPDASIASRIARAVAAAGHAPVMLGDGERAIDRFVQEPADVLVVDYFLPGRDGVATVESIRWAPGGRDAHVVLIADRETEPVGLAELGLRVGAVATLIGPPTDEGIGSILRELGKPAPIESTRVATLDELTNNLAKAQLPTSALDRRVIDGPKAPHADHRVPLRGTPPAGRNDDDATTAPGDEANEAPAWPALETVMAHAGVRARPAGGSGVQRRPETELTPADDDDPPTAPGGRVIARPTSPPPPLPEHESARADAPRKREIAPDAAAIEEGRDVGEGMRESERGARPRVMGRFEDLTFAALMRRLADGRTNGALVCVADGLKRDTTSGDPPTKIVYYRAGVPVHVRSNLVDECLGQILLRRKRIGIATLEESMRRMKLGEGLQGEILIDMGALAPLELGEALADQARDKLFDLFGWTRGTYRLSKKLEPPPGAVGIELGLAEIIYEGVCAAMPPTRLLELLSPNLEKWVMPDPVQLARFVRVRLVPEVRHVLARIDGTLRLRDVLSMGTRPGAVAQLVYSMECLAAVKFVDKPRVLKSADGTPLEPAQSPPPTLPPDEPLTERPPPGEGPPDVIEMPRLSIPEPVAEPASESATSEEATPHEVLGAPATGEAWDDSTAPARERRDSHAIMERLDPPIVTLASSGARALPAAPEEGSGLVATPEQEERAVVSTVGHVVGGTTGQLDAQVDRLFEAERHFRRGNRALDRSRWGEALSAFAKAYELCPDQGEFLAYVGWTRHCLSPDDVRTNAQALDELARARELAPDLHVTHLLHGRVLATAGRREEAYGAYLRALDLDPGCTEARDALAQMR